MRLQINVQHLTPPIETVEKIHTMWTKQRTILRISGQLRQLENDSAATLAAALLGMFAFWLCHKAFVLEIKSYARICVKTKDKKG